MLGGWRERREESEWAGEPPLLERLTASSSDSSSKMRSRRRLHKEGRRLASDDQPRERSASAPSLIVDLHVALSRAPELVVKRLAFLMCVEINTMRVKRQGEETDLFELYVALLEVLVLVVIFFVVGLTLYGTGRRRRLGWDRRGAHDDVLLALGPVLRGRHCLLASDRHGGREERVRDGKGR